MKEAFQEFRAAFPVMKQAIYLNHAAISPMSEFHHQAMEQYYRIRSMLPVDLWPDSIQLKKEFKENIARLIHASAEEIIITENTSHGLNLFVRSFPWEAGDEIILNTIEFPANVYPYLQLESGGVRIKWVRISPRVYPDFHRITSMVTSRTKAIAISFVQFLNGYRADLKKLGQFCRERGILLIVDGIQGTGVMPVDVEEMNIDVFSTAGHKWLMWPMGTGFLYIRREILNQLNPIFTGWLSVKDSWNFFDYRLDYLENGEKFEGGTLNYPGIYVANQLLKQFFLLGPELIHERIMQLSDYLYERCQEEKIAVISPGNRNHRSGIITVDLPDSHNIFKKLKEQNIIVSYREGFIRFSPHCYNLEEELDEALDVIIYYNEKS